MKTTFFLVLILAAAAIADPIHMKMKRKAHSPEYIKAMLTIDAQNRAGAYPTLEHDANNLPLVNGDELLYYAEIEFGTPLPGTKPQMMKIDCDTGSSDLWTSSAKCAGCGFPSPSFNSSASSTYKQLSGSFNIQYGSGSVSGYKAEDVVTVGGLVVKDQTFGLATQASGFSGAGINGLMGLAYESISAEHAPSPFDNMYSQGLISKKEFSVFLSADVDKDAQITFGGTDKKLYKGDFTYTPITADEWYVMEFKSFSIDGKDLFDHGINKGAIADTGTSLLVVPTSVADKIADKVTVNSNCQGNDNNPDIVINISGTDFTLTPDDYIVELQEGQCVNGIQGADIGAPFGTILGDVFLRTVYTKFDVANNQLGFAQLA